MSKASRAEQVSERSFIVFPPMVLVSASSAGGHSCSLLLTAHFWRLCSSSGMLFQNFWPSNTTFQVLGKWLVESIWTENTGADVREIQANELFL